MRADKATNVRASARVGGRRDGAVGHPRGGRVAAAAAPAPAGDGAIKFKVLSFFVGSTAAGRGRLHQQSIVLSDGVNSADDERGG